MVNDRDVLDVVEVALQQDAAAPENFLDPFVAVLGEVDGPLLLVEFVVVLADLGNDFVDGKVKVRLVVERA